jgi:hypothetical protein
VNNPGVKTETHTVGLPVHIAKRYLDDPENRKQFATSSSEGTSIGKSVLAIGSGILGQTDEAPVGVDEER